MIEIVSPGGKLTTISGLEEWKPEYDDFISIQFSVYNEEIKKWLQYRYHLDLDILKTRQDIEVSSHFVTSEDQASFQFDVSYYYKPEEIIEESIFLILQEHRVFVFMTESLSSYFEKLYHNKLKRSMEKLQDSRIIFQKQIQFISDYFADITEYITKDIKTLANRILLKKQTNSDDLDVITHLNFNNLMIRESLNVTTRVLHLFRKSDWDCRLELTDFINAELEDLSIVSDHIQFNFERLDDLKENVGNKIDLEQNKIVKILTMVTLCIALPTLIAGVYGMNFDDMPELHKKNGYPTAIVAMIVSAILPYIYFKSKKWW